MRNAPQPHSRLLASLVVLGVAVATALWTLRPAMPQERQDQMAENAQPHAAIAELTGIRLPPDSKVVYFFRAVGGEPMMRAKIAMSRSALDAMMTDNNWAPDAFSSANQGFLGVDDGDWAPQSRPPFPVMAREPISGEFLYVGHEPSDDGVLVYLYWFRT
jgi:hypothetical protein